MGFFSRKHKNYAKCNYKTLQDGYYASEIGLKKAVASGNEKAMHKAMKQHQLFEYALLYKNTPEYKAKQKVIISKNKAPVRKECKYNAQIYTDVGNGFAYTGNGKFFETKKEAVKYKNQFNSKKV